MINLICPYCGGAFQLDAKRDLQKQWTCPYCGNKSQMEKQDDQVKLIGLVESSKPEFPAQERPDKEESGQTEPISPIAHASAPARPLAEMIAEAEEPGTTDYQADNAKNNSPPVSATSENVNQEGPQIRPFKMDTGKYERIVRSAEQAARRGNLALFSIYSRKALSINPEDPRMYAWQAILREKANSFANSTWASPIWTYLTPRQKRQLLAQKFHSLNTAIKLSDRTQKDALIENVAVEIVRQAVEFFTEQAEIRRRRMFFVRKFKGRFRRADLKTAKNWINALAMIDRDICPDASGELKTVATEKIKINHPLLARKLKRKLKKITITT